MAICLILLNSWRVGEIGPDQGDTDPQVRTTRAEERAKFAYRMKCLVNVYEHSPIVNRYAWFYYGCDSRINTGAQCDYFGEKWGKTSLMYKITTYDQKEVFSPTYLFHAYKNLPTTVKAPITPQPTSGSLPTASPPISQTANNQLPSPSATPTPTVGVQPTVTTRPPTSTPRPPTYTPVPPTRTPTPNYNSVDLRNCPMMTSQSVGANSLNLTNQYVYFASFTAHYKGIVSKTNVKIGNWGGMKRTAFCKITDSSGNQTIATEIDSDEFGYETTNNVTWKKIDFSSNLPRAVLQRGATYRLY